MQINPVMTPLQLGDRLHIFTTSMAAAEAALDCLTTDAVLDCALHHRLTPPYTSRSLPTALALLNIIPERDEDMKSFQHNHENEVETNPLNSRFQPNPINQETEETEQKKY